MKLFKKLVGRFKITRFGSLFFYREIVLSNGIKLKADITDAFYLKKERDSFDISVIEKIVRPGDNCIDVGANIGLYSIVMARCGYDIGRVYAFEPVKSTFNILKKNIALNDFINILPINKGVGDSKGTKEINITAQSELSSIGNNGRGTIIKKQEIDICSLDEYLTDGIDIRFLKIDVEGFEKQVLYGARNLIEDSKNLVIMLELNEKNLAVLGSSAKEVITFLNGFGYRGYAMNRQKRILEPITEDIQSINYIFSKNEII